MTSYDVLFLSFEINKLRIGSIWGSYLASSSTISSNFGFSEKHLAANLAIPHGLRAIYKPHLLERPRSPSGPAWALQAPHHLFLHPLIHLFALCGEISRNDISELILIQIIFLLNCRPKKQFCTSNERESSNIWDKPNQPCVKPQHFNIFSPQISINESHQQFLGSKTGLDFHTPQSHIRVEVRWNLCWRIESNHKCQGPNLSGTEIHTWACLEQRASGLTLLQFAIEKSGTKFNVLSHPKNMEAKEGPVEQWDSGHGHHNFLVLCWFSERQHQKVYIYISCRVLSGQSGKHLFKIRTLI